MQGQSGMILDKTHETWEIHARSCLIFMQDYSSTDSCIHHAKFLVKTFTSVSNRDVLVLVLVYQNKTSSIPSDCQLLAILLIIWGGEVE